VNEDRIHFASHASDATRIWPPVVAVFFAASADIHTRLPHLSRRDLDSAGYSAATDMLVQDAKRLALLHGNYSRVGFYHPGPHLFYLMAAGEFLFRDLLGIAKSTEAAQ